MATYRTAMGKAIDIDTLRVANESVIAVGNMRTNGRGDELGSGGQVVKTRAQLMQEYHKLNTPVASHDEVVATATEVPALRKSASKVAQPTAVDIPVAISSAAVVEEVVVAADDTTAPGYVKPRGSFADAVAKTTEVTQVLLDPLPGVTPGVKRI
jgi:hypothetical protein